MNKLKLYEAMNLIDDDLVKEAEMPTDNVSEAKNADNTEPELTVSGVEPYRRPIWHKITAIASAVVIIAGAVAGGTYYMKHRGSSAPDEDIINSEAIAPTTEDGKESASSTVASDKGEKSPSTTTAAYEKAEQLANTSGPPVKGETAKTTAAGKSTSAARTTAKANTASSGRSTTAVKTTTAAKTTQSPATTTAPVPIPPADGRLTLDLVKRYAEYGDKLTWGDLRPYNHDDVGSGRDMWVMPVYTENKDGKLESEFTLVVLGIANDKETPETIKMVYGKYYNSYLQEYIDIRYENVMDFVLKCRQKAGDPNTLTDVLGDIKDCHVDYIRCVELTNPMYNYYVALGKDEIRELIPMIQKLTFTKNVGDEWRYLDGNFTHIYVTDNKGLIHDYTLAGNQYFAVEGTGYAANYNDLLAIDTYTLSLLTKAKPSAPVDVDGVWCWHDATVDDFDIRSFENITIKQYPDYVFSWNGMKRTIEIYNKKTREKFGSVATYGQAYFADLNGDGYPELCTSYDWGLNSRIVGEVAAWDIHNGMIFRMNDPENEMIYWLYEEDGELRVNRQPSISSWSPDSKHGEQGRLEIGNYEVKFIPV